MGKLLLLILTSLATVDVAPAWSAQEIRIEHMTWLEMRDGRADGKTTVIIPTGGTEQNGAHMVLGKHNFIVAETARQIAVRLGDAMVAPVVAYVPEGDIESRAGHMAYPGTISVPGPVFAQVLSAAAASFKMHGFTKIVFLGDSGGNQRAQSDVAMKLSAQWSAVSDSTPLVMSVSRYYKTNGAMTYLKSEGETQASIGGHAGIQDTSKLMAIFPAGVNLKKVMPGGGNGASGDASHASIKYGRALLESKITAAVEQIQAIGGQ